MKNFLLGTVLSVLFISCKTKSAGFTDPKEVYEQSMAAMQSGDKEKIRSYVEKVLPDDGTIASMKKMDFHYRGLPEELKDHPDGLKDWRKEFTDRLYEFSKELESRGILKDLKFIGFDEDYEPEDIGGKEKTGVLFTEPYGVFGCPKDTIEYKIGELLKINGVWKSFTEAKL